MIQQRLDLSRDSPTPSYLSPLKFPLPAEFCKRLRVAWFLGMVELTRSAQHLYDGVKPGTSNSVTFTFISGTRGEVAEPIRTPAECSRGGTLTNPDVCQNENGDPKPGTSCIYQCGIDGPIRVEENPPAWGEEDEEKIVYSRRVTVCARGELRMVVFEEDGAVYLPVPDPVPQGAIIVDYCVKWEELLCDDGNQCICANGEEENGDCK